LRAYNAAKCDCGRDGALPRTPLGELTALPQTLAGSNGSLRGGRGRGRREGVGREGERREREESDRGMGRGGEVDSDAQLEQGRRLALRDSKPAK